MAISKINVNGTTHDIKDSSALPKSGGSLSGNITFANNKGVYGLDASGISRSLLRLSASNNLLLGDTNISGYICAYKNLSPSASYSNTFNLGATSQKWKNLYLGGSITDGTNKATIKEIGYLSGVTSPIQTQLDGKSVSGEYLQDDTYFPNNRSIDDLKSSADVGFYIGNGYSLIVTEGSCYGDYNVIHQIKITDAYTANGTPTIYIRQYFMSGAYQDTWTDWAQIGGSGGIVIGELESYHHDSGHFVEDDLKTDADVGFYKGDTYTLLVTHTDSSYMESGGLVSQLKFSYEGEATPVIYHRVCVNNSWSAWEKVGGSEFTLTVEKLTEVIPEGFGHSLSATSETFSNTYYYTYDSEGSLTNPNNMKAGDIVTLNITYGDGSTDTLTAEKPSSGAIDFGNGVSLSLSAYFVSADMGYEVTYNLSGINDISTWSYTVTRIRKINEKYLPESTTATTLYEHTYSFTSNREEVFTMSWTDKYASYGSTVETIMSNLTSRCKGKTFIASGYSFYNSGPIAHVVVGTDTLEPFCVSTPSGFSGGNAYDSDSLTLDSYSDRACS